MLSGRMANGSIGISSSPSQDGSAIDDEVACADQPTSNGGQHAEHKERLWERGSSAGSSPPLLGGTGNPWSTIAIQRQATSQG